MPVTGITLALTVTVHVAVSPFAVDAVIVAFPSLTAVTDPFSSTVAISGSLDVHVTVLSEAFSGSMVAVIVFVSPSVSERVVGSRVMPVIGVGTTVTAHVAVLPPQVAVMVASPRAMAFTFPSASTVAISGLLEVQVTVLSVASSGSTLASSRSVSPTLREALS